MRQLVVVDPEKCNLSLACIRTCPTKAIKIEETHATIVPGRCIGCGHCVMVCSQNAISYRDEKQIVKDFLASGSKVAIICDPSISGEFVDITDHRKFVAMIRGLGFNYVLEMAFGIDLLAFRYRDLLHNFHGKYYIHTVCPPVAAYVEKFEPELVENLARMVPPYVVMAKVVREYYGDDLKLVYATACVAAKDDARMHKDDGRIDGVLTFIELRELFKEFKITENNVEYSEFDPPIGRKGGLYPIRRGMLQAVDINQELLSGDIISANGQFDFKESLSEFKSQTGLKQHLDLFYCEGCVMGPGMSPGGKKFMRRSEVIKYVNKRLKGLDLVNWHEQIEQFKDLDVSRTFKAQDRRLPMPPDSEIRRVLHEMGKSKAEDQLGCGACGYPSCREFAIAYCQGLTNYEMCYSYSINKLHTFINKVNATNEKLKKTKEALKDSEEKARAGEMAALEAAEVTTIMLDKINAGVVVVDENLKIMESNHVFVEMLGEDAQTINDTIPGLKGAELSALVPFHRLFASVLQSGQDMLNRDTPFGNSIFNVSVFTIKKHKAVGGIIRDLTSPNVRREEVINRARTVIRENLETVQQIAFLLGESASKTEKILSSIIDAQKLGTDTTSSEEKTDS
ncbi:[Fe-Fe] hydrogenase large subunit C-terminal domain-containing protein [Natronoflexus pectinivorans]|uniref:Iron only hydrogenase large subunit-like protein n=1 Tax=Natronoflexus pectinivorans TaxID=682526 RepID=A0A4V2RWR7_9BACT|nr:[Fe-Fe] hydrogenase large subunit C-terminal domain-containing protein [Natronoflexus pectinivorans]TCO09721.1 iron only hydrogenase large subunit-like protein [Natronoflexus pectinivorans]